MGGTRIRKTIAVRKSIAVAALVGAGSLGAAIPAASAATVKQLGHDKVSVTQNGKTKVYTKFCWDFVKTDSDLTKFAHGKVKESQLTKDGFALGAQSATDANDGKNGGAREKTLVTAFEKASQGANATKTAKTYKAMAKFCHVRPSPTVVHGLGG